MKILRLNQVMELTGLSRSTIYRYMQNKQFPIPVKLGIKIVGWIDYEITGWITNKIESRDSNVSTG